jgi:hypothetical protein
MSADRLFLLSGAVLLLEPRGEPPRFADFDMVGAEIAAGRLRGVGCPHCREVFPWSGQSLNEADRLCCPNGHELARRDDPEEQEIRRVLRPLRR